MSQQLLKKLSFENNTCRILMKLLTLLLTIVALAFIVGKRILILVRKKSLNGY